MTRLGLVTNVRNYNRRTGGHTDGRLHEDGTGGGRHSYHRSKTSSRTPHTTQGYTWVGGIPSNADLDGWQDRPPASSRGGKARQRHLVPPPLPCLADRQPGFPPAVLAAKADGAWHPRFLDHGSSPAGRSYPVQSFWPPLPALAHLGASQEATSFCRGQR